ncbi:MAG: hypothetical protein MAG458_00281 [Nitrosopumilus sp.]|nr:hypothetical protein [Nitrosopumilus sp.]
MIGLLILSSVTNRPPSKEIFDARKECRDLLIKQIKIVSGSVEATEEVIYKTVDELYNFIIDLQGHNFLGGSFLPREIKIGFLTK